MKSNTLSQRIACFSPGFVAVAIIVAAGLITAPTVMPDMDSAEFARIAAQGGIAHPPGYPLFSALLRGWHLLVAVYVAHPSAPTSIPALVWLQLGIAGVTTWILWCALHCNLTLKTADRPVADLGHSWKTGWIACLATLAVMLAAPVWRSSTGLEPFPLNLLMAASLLWLLAQSQITSAFTESAAVNPDLAIAGTGLIFGLAFCNHHSLAFAAPLAWPILRTRPIRRALPLVTVGFISGLAPLIWFPVMLRNPQGFIWGDWTHFSNRLITHLFRRDYGTFQLIARQKPAPETLKQKLIDTLDGPLFALHAIAESLSWGWLAVAGIGIYCLVGRQSARQGPSENNQFVRFSLYSAASTGLLMALMFNAPSAPDTIEIQRRFMALPILLLAPAISLGLSTALKFYGKPQPPQRALIRATVVLILFGHIAAQFPQSNRKPEVLAEHHLRQSLIAIEAALGPAIEPAKKTWIITNSDLDFFAFKWASTQTTTPPLIIQSGLWGNTWYRARMLAEIVAGGVQIPPDAQRQLSSPTSSQSSFEALAWLVSLHVQSGGVVYLAAGTFPYLERILQLESLPVAGMIRVGRPPAEFSGQDGNRNLVRFNTELIDPLLRALKLYGGRCKTAWDCHALSGWQRTFTALQELARAENDHQSLESCTKIVQLLQEATFQPELSTP